MQQKFILTKLGAFSLCSEGTDLHSGSAINEVLKSSRTFDPIALTVQPILLSEGGGVQSTSTERLADKIAFSCSGLFYEITIDDELVTQSNLLDAIHGALTLLEHVDDDLFLMPIHPEDIPKNRILDMKVAVELYKKTMPYTSCVFDFESVFLNCWHSSYEFDELLWSIVSYIANDLQAIYATNFLRTSYSEYQFLGDDIDEVILANTETPGYISEAVKMENALHNCYKVVEAICGGTLPASQRKVIKKLAAIGIDPSELVGYDKYGVFHKATILSKIESLRDVRNRRAGHGNIERNRKSTYYELMDYQALANSLIQKYLKHKFPNIPI